MQEKFKLNDDAMCAILDSFDDTGGYLIKISELRYWIEYYVNKDRKDRRYYAIRKLIPKFWKGLR